ncbi:hypothetical protein DFP72DRAFT_1009369 [Ephemerocybe angulata]|uniref:Fungal-type protein kinase domain-containing protein n=1 Tax=Ephemerocybe angulata TaxID=980116 RepID=A0A8H6M7B0_9AGAR|nr:hypothetical protein DFP72DRAFT_1009369 [Tulosesus angulatus]
MVQDLRHCEAQIFITHYLPTPKEGLVAKVVDSLFAGGALKESSRTNSMTDSNCFPYTFGDLSENSSGEFISKVSHFERIMDVGERIREILVQEANLSRSELSEPLESASCNPHPSQARPYGHPDRRFSFGTAVGDFKVGACLLEGVHCPHDSGSKLPTHRILVPLEVALKATEGDVRQNGEKVFAAVNSIMNGDARRDFVYGITNEDDRVSLWYFSRTHSVKTSSFSLMKNPDQLVRVLVSLLSASDEDLGLNPNIALYPKKHANPGFIYRFPGDSAGSSRFFKTTGVIQEASSETLSSGTTRVWKAVEVANFEGHDLVPKVTAMEVIIKDVWIDASGDTEKEIQDKVFKSIDDFVEGPEPWRNHPCLAKLKPSHFDAFQSLVANKKYRERFLQIREDFQGAPSKSVAEKTWASTTRTGRVEQETGGVVHTEFAPKRRCFFMFDDVCTRVSHVPVFGDAVDIIRQASTVLILMFCAGWIHRDISTGNLLAIEENGEGWVLKLADLEYAIPFPPSTPQARDNWNIGTSFFMATELQTNFSQYVKPSQPFDLAELYESGDYRTNAVAREEEVVDTVVHNLQHDLESLWWIVFYLGAIKTVTDKSTYALMCALFVDIFGSLEKTRDKWGPIPITSGGGESKKRAREDDEVIRLLEPLLLPPRTFMFNYMASIAELTSDSPRRHRDPAPAGMKRSEELGEEIAAAMTEEFVYCKSQTFIDHYLPEIDDVLVDKVITYLEGDHLEAAGSELVFTEFQEKPSTTARSEAEAYRHISRIGEAIRTEVNKEARSIASKKSELGGPLPSRLRVHDCPNRWLGSEMAGCDFKIDACILEVVDYSDGNGDKLESHRIVVPFEFKLSTKKKDVKKNRRQLLAACNQIMNGDVRRDFMYGVSGQTCSCATTRVSLWYFSRNQSAKASSFSLIKHPKQFIRVMVSLLSASDEDLGINPNIVLYPKKHPDPAFIFGFPCGTAGIRRFFKTTSIVEECRSKRLSGRETRVWKAVEVANFEGKALADNLTPKEIIIKDVWIDGPADTEKQIQDKVFKNIDDFVDDPQPWRDHPCLAKFPPSRLDDLETLITNKKYQERFLRIRGHFEGPLSKSVAKDAWASPSIFTQARVEAVSMSPLKTQRNRSEYEPTPASQVAPVPKSALQFKMSGEIHTEFAPKKRCFFYFDEVCTRVSHVPTFGDAVDILRQASAVLILMFCAGWIHRDISTGNVLAMKESDGKWLLKLADLEYAKEFPSPGQKARADWKTGTPYFMATELQRGRYLQPQKTLELIEPDSETRVEAAQVDDDVVHNLQHDLESLWWIGFYIGAVKVGHQASALWCSKAYIFQPVIEENPDAPRHRIMLQGFPQELNAALHPDLTEFMGPWKKLRNNLLAHYQKRSPDKVTDKGTYAQIAWHFLNFFYFLENSRNKWGPIQIVEPPGSDEPKKRGREEDGGGQAKGVKRGSNQQEDTDAGPSAKRPRVATPTPLQVNEEGGDLFGILKARPTRGGPSSTKSRRSGK